MKGKIISYEAGRKDNLVNLTLLSFYDILYGGFQFSWQLNIKKYINK
jgi:hypothetical protein